MGNYISESLLSERVGPALLDQLINIKSAAATATLAATVLSSIDVTDKGGGYSSSPTVVLTGGGGSNAAAVANIVDGYVDSVTVTAGGSGYTSTPVVSFTGGGVTPEAKTAAVANVIERAEGVVDGHLGAVYSTPVAANALGEEWALRVAVYELYSRSSWADVPQKIKDAYDDAIKQLEKVADGKMVLSSSVASSSDDQAIIFEGNETNYPDDDMRCF